MNSRHPSVIQPSERQITGHIVPRRGYLGVFSIALSSEEIGRKIFSTRHVVLQHACNLYIFQHGSTVGQSIVGLRCFNSERIRLTRYLRAVDISPCTGTQTDRCCRCPPNKGCAKWGEPPELRRNCRRCCRLQSNSRRKHRSGKPQGW